MSVLGPSIGYVDMLDIVTLEKAEQEQREGRKYTPLRPSSAGKCSRELAHEFMEYRGKATYEKEVLLPDQVRLFSLGHSVEWNILKQFEDAKIFGVKYRQQVVSFFELTPSEWIEGSVDAVFVSEKFKAVIDIKSKKDKFSGWYSTKWDEDTEKYKSLKSVTTISDKAFWVEDLVAFISEVSDPFLAMNFYQLNMYAHSGFLKERGIDHGAIIQYNKNDSRLREIRFSPSLELYNRVLNKFKSVREAVDTLGDPTKVAKEFTLGSIKCAFCAFKSVCWPDKDALQAYFDTWPKKKWPTKTSALGEVGEELEELYRDFAFGNKVADELIQTEQAMTRILDEEQVNKIKFSDGAVYELKYYKSPKPHLKLKRSKA